MMNRKQSLKSGQFLRLLLSLALLTLLGLLVLMPATDEFLRTRLGGMFADVRLFDAGFAMLSSTPADAAVTFVRN